MVVLNIPTVKVIEETLKGLYPKRTRLPEKTGLETDTLLEVPLSS